MLHFCRQVPINQFLFPCLQTGQTGLATLATTKHPQRADWVTLEAVHGSEHPCRALAPRAGPPKQCGRAWDVSPRGPITTKKLVSVRIAQPLVCLCQGGVRPITALALVRALSFGTALLVHHLWYGEEGMRRKPTRTGPGFSGHLLPSGLPCSLRKHSPGPRKGQLHGVAVLRQHHGHMWHDRGEAVGNGNSGHGPRSHNNQSKKARTPQHNAMMADSSLTCMHRPL